MAFPKRALTCKAQIACMDAWTSQRSVSERRLGKTCEDFANAYREAMATQLLPLELIDKCVGSPIWVIMKGDKGKI